MTFMVIDLETLSTETNAVVFAVGLAAFDIQSFDPYTPVMTDVLYLSPKAQKGRAIDPDTVAWWFKQSEEAKAEFHIACDEGLGMRQVADAINRFYLDSGSHQVFGNGPTFDLAITEDLMKDAFTQPAFSFREMRCVRTLCEACGVDWKKYIKNGETGKGEGHAHTALGDAVAEGRGLVECYMKLAAAGI